MPHSHDIFRAFVVTEHPDGSFTRGIETRYVHDLPSGDVLIRVHYSSLNYKDALSAFGNKGVTKQYPHTPGIDAAGVVVQSSSPQFQQGDEVVVTGYDLGMNTSGGFGQFIRVPAGWVVPLPNGLSLRESMIYGTAGFTAGLCLRELLAAGITPEDGSILVTGATGGVGTVAISLLHKLGYSVTAVTGKTDATEYLKKTGASAVITREEATDISPKALLKPLWAGVIDSLGGNILSTALKSTKPNGTVVICGNAASAELNTTVFPFILRGINLIGVDSQNCAMNIRKEVWEKLAGIWKLESLDWITTEIPLEELNTQIDQMKEGRMKGRVVVNVNL